MRSDARRDKGCGFELETTSLQLPRHHVRRNRSTYHARTGNGLPGRGSGMVMLRFRQLRSEYVKSGCCSSCWMKSFVSLMKPLGTCGGAGLKRLSASSTGIESTKSVAVSDAGA